MGKELKKTVMMDHFSVNVDASTNDGGSIVMTFVDVDTNEEVMIVMTHETTCKWLRKALKQARDLAWN